MYQFAMKSGMGLGLLVGMLGTAWADGTGGCVNSPEGPTLLLAMLGIAAAGVRRLRQRKLDRTTKLHSVA